MSDKVYTDRQNLIMNNNEITSGRNVVKFMGDERGLPIQPPDKKRKNFLGILGGVGYNVNHIIGAGIFDPDDIWTLMGSPGVVLMFWILGGIISLFGTLIYTELGIRSLPKGIGEQRYIDNAFPSKKHLGHVFSFVAITIIFPVVIIADAYSCAQHLLYLFDINPDPKEYFGKDYIAQRLLSIFILAIITAYNMYSNKLSVYINQVLVFIKIIAIFLISIIGLMTLTKSNTTNWAEIYNSPTTYVGAYGSGILKSSFNNAFNNSIALRFGYKLFNNNETGVTFMSALIAISAFGCVGSMVFSYARIIKYAAATKFIPKYSYKFNNFHKKYGTPFNALLAQFIYCSIFLLLFFNPSKDLFDVVAVTSQIIAIMFHGASAICLFVLKKDPSNFQIPKWIIVIYPIFVTLIVITSFFPTGPGQLNYILYMLPYGLSVVATLLGVIIWRFRNYSDDSDDPGSETVLKTSRVM
ncbi:11295_t:CDS:2 [Dentiscutata erythropus]|uniref:11295_t:CDS:1 n=1 Tax=Dentiscutata erythropus TaxID=1348616 RepID=A0A9N8V9T3_9GLOM|nr:11295_t:CDS:2 [Dentiscutata erythropus]